MGGVGEYVFAGKFFCGLIGRVESVWEEKWYLLFSKISFCFRDIQVFKICKLANW